MRTGHFFSINRAMTMLALFGLIVLTGCTGQKQPMMDDMHHDTMSKPMSKEQPMQDSMMKDHDTMDQDMNMDMKKDAKMMQ